MGREGVRGREGKAMKDDGRWAVLESSYPDVVKSDEKLEDEKGWKSRKKS